MNRLPWKQSMLLKLLDDSLGHNLVAQMGIVEIGAREPKVWPLQFLRIAAAQHVVGKEVQSDEVAVRESPAASRKSYPS